MTPSHKDPWEEKHSLFIFVCPSDANTGLKTFGWLESFSYRQCFLSSIDVDQKFLQLTEAHTFS